MSLFKRLLCSHDISPEIRSDKRNQFDCGFFRAIGKHRYHYCKKCGKRWYED